MAWDAAAAAAVLHSLAWHLWLTLWMCEAQHVEPLSRLQVLAWDRLPTLHGVGCGCCGCDAALARMASAAGAVDRVCSNALPVQSAIVAPFHVVVVGLATDTVA